VFQSEKTRRSDSQALGKSSISLASPLQTEEPTQLHFQLLAHPETLRGALFFLWNFLLPLYSLFGIMRFEDLIAQQKASADQKNLCAKLVSF
jgi:hypothetical protein